MPSKAKAFKAARPFAGASSAAALAPGSPAQVPGGQLPFEPRLLRPVAPSGARNAIFKVAQETEYPPGHIQLMVQAYNTARTNHQRQDATTVSEKTAAFPLANAAYVLRVLYPDNIKEAAASPPARNLDELVVNVRHRRRGRFVPAHVGRPEFRIFLAANQFGVLQNMIRVM